MTEEEFLGRIYRGIGPGIKVLIPKRKTDIVEIRDNGDIVYEVANAYRKILSRRELVGVYQHLSQGPLETSALRRIVPASRTCNVSTIKWLLSHADLAAENGERAWERRW